MNRRLVAWSFALAAIPALAACSGSTPPGGQDDPDASVHNPDDPDASTSNPDTPDANVSHPEPDARVDPACSDWRTGTLTGYNNSDLGDDPNAGNVMEFGGLNDDFYNHVDMAAVDLSDWGSGQYHYLDVNYNGQVRRVQVWDACLNADCPDGTDCCTENKNLFANPGYLVDVENRTAARLWGVQNAEDVLQEEIPVRVCGSFDPDAIADMYGAHRNE
jgi:hypothetical protein